MSLRRAIPRSMTGCETVHFTWWTDAYRKWQERQGLIVIDPFQYSCFAAFRPFADQSDSLHRWLMLAEGPARISGQKTLKDFVSLCVQIRILGKTKPNRTATCSSRPCYPGFEHGASGGGPRHGALWESWCQMQERTRRSWTIK